MPSVEERLATLEAQRTSDKENADRLRSYIQDGYKWRDDTNVKLESIINMQREEQTYRHNCDKDRKETNDKVSKHETRIEGVEKSQKNMWRNIAAGGAALAVIFEGGGEVLKKVFNLIF